MEGPPNPRAGVLVERLRDDEGRHRGDVSTRQVFRRPQVLGEAERVRPGPSTGLGPGVPRSQTSGPRTNFCPPPCDTVLKVTAQSEIGALDCLFGLFWSHSQGAGPGPVTCYPLTVVNRLKVAQPPLVQSPPPAASRVAAGQPRWCLTFSCSRRPAEGFCPVPSFVSV